MTPYTAEDLELMRQAARAYRDWQKGRGQVPSKWLEEKIAEGLRADRLELPRRSSRSVPAWTAA